MLILASKSATRKTLLDNAGLAFSVASAPIDEHEIETRLLTAGENRKGLAKELAKAKALAVSATRPGAWVIGADQTLTFGDEIVHKPRDFEDAVDRMTQMAGESHHLHSGAALARDGEIVWSCVQSAVLTVKPLARAQIGAILAREGEAILSSVGGYRLEGPSVRLFSHIEGDYFTILGLPLLALLAAIETHAPELVEGQ